MEDLGTLTDLITDQQMDLYLRDDFTTSIDFYLAQGNFKFRTREEPGEIILMDKFSATERPALSRPTLGKRYLAEEKLVATKMFTDTHLRKEDMDTYEHTQKFLMTYGDHHSKDWVKENLENKLDFDMDRTIAWIQSRSDSARVAKETIKFIEDEILTKPVSDVNVHMKTESWLKSKMILNIDDMTLRQIVW